jgi:hypothetical protein
VSSYQIIRYERPGDVATLTLARPEKPNPQNPLMWQELGKLGAEFMPDRSLRSPVVAGEGPSFSAGIDLIEGLAGIIAEFAATKDLLSRVSISHVPSRVAATPVVRQRAGGRHGVATARSERAVARERQSCRAGESSATLSTNMPASSSKGPGAVHRSHAWPVGPPLDSDPPHRNGRQSTAKGWPRREGREDACSVASAPGTRRLYVPGPRSTA